MTRRRILLFTAVPLTAQFPGGIFSKLKTNPKLADGLKEALRVGTNNAVSLTGRLNGYFANEVIKILLPEPIPKSKKPSESPDLAANSMNSSSA